MPYFTSWDINLYLCLYSLGLHHDISLSMTREIKKIHRDYCLEEARSYYLDRKNWLPRIGGKRCTLKKDRYAEKCSQIWIPDERELDTCIWSKYGLVPYSLHRYFSLRTIIDIKSIPDQFWNNLGIVNFEYENLVRKTEPEDRNDYFEWAYENHYHGWDRGVFEWVKGFHLGRWILMDMKRGEALEDIRDLEDYGAYIEERFIRSKKHIDDLLTNKRD